MTTSVDVEAPALSLRERVDGEFRFDAGSRAASSTDAPNFRQVLIGVLVPHTPEAAADATGVARHHGTLCCPAAAPASPASVPTRPW